MKVAIIPARSGSKRIKNKNIKNFNGLPIIAWVLKEINQSGFFDKIYVDTDSIEISKIAKKYGASIPFLRPKYLARDNSSLRDTSSYFVKKIVKKNYVKNNCYICFIYATAFSIKISDLYKSYKEFNKKKPEFMISATKFKYSVRRSFEVDKNNKMKMLFPKMYNKRSQEIKETFHDAGQFFWAKADTIIKKKRVFTKKSLIYKIPSNRVIDIDTYEDWKFAEYVYKYLNNK